MRRGIDEGRSRNGVLYRRTGRGNQFRVGHSTGEWRPRRVVNQGIHSQYLAHELMFPQINCLIGTVALAAHPLTIGRNGNFPSRAAWPRSDPRRASVVGLAKVDGGDAEIGVIKLIWASS